MNIRHIIGAAGIALLLLSSWSHAAEVRSISREVKSEVDGNTVWTVYIKCAGVADKRAVERVGKKRAKWCSEHLPTLCDRKKVKAAEKVCGTHFERLVNEYYVKKANQEAVADGN